MRSHAIGAELEAWRTELGSERGGELNGILRARPWRVVADILFDWAVIALAVASVCGFSAWLGLAAIVIIGNRQRALGNLLHDAGHRNLSRNARLNDGLAGLLVAPALLVDLHAYRRTHAQHHAALGDAGRDPDLIPPAASPFRAWSSTFWGLLTDRKAWQGCVFGHVGVVDDGWMLLRMGAWWMAVVGGVGLVAGTRPALIFVALWFAARATVFHAITAFREMCDHYGLTPGGVVSYTRDIHTFGPLRWLFHPRNNGYHLTHHLMPAVPYHQLPAAHALLRRRERFRHRAVVCDGYFRGSLAVVQSNTCWRAPA
jgi:fatty acid desaturase